MFVSEGVLLVVERRHHLLGGRAEFGKQMFSTCLPPPLFCLRAPLPILPCPMGNATINDPVHVTWHCILGLLGYHGVQGGAGEV